MCVLGEEGGGVVGNYSHVRGTVGGGGGWVEGGGGH